MNETNREKKYCHLSSQTVQMYGEAIGITDLPPDITKALASDASYRLKEALNVTKQFMLHNKRTKLTCEDFNRTLKWMDVPPIPGYRGIDKQEWISIPEAGVFIPQDNSVNISSSAASVEIFNQPGSPFIKGEWSHVSNYSINTDTSSHERTLVREPLPQELTQYYHAIFASVTNPSDVIFQKICKDIVSSTTIEPLVGSLLGGIIGGAQKAHQKSTILQRLLLLIKALIFNPYIFLGPPNYMQDIVNILVFCVVTERKTPQDTQTIRSLAISIILQLCRSPDSTAWDFSVRELGGVIGINVRPWHQHSGGLFGLLTLGPKALDLTLGPCCKKYCQKLQSALTNGVKGSMSYKESLDAHMASGLLMCSFVKVIVSLIRKLPNHQEIPSTNGNSQADTIEKICEYYYTGEAIYGSAFSLQIPPISLHLSSNIHSNLPISPVHIPIKRKLFFKKTKRRVSPSSIFKSYKHWEPIYRPFFMSIRSCSSRHHSSLNLHRKSTVMKRSTLESWKGSPIYEIAPMPHRILGSQRKTTKHDSFFLHHLML